MLRIGGLIGVALATVGATSVSALSKGEAELESMAARQSGDQTVTAGKQGAATAAGQQAVGVLRRPAPVPVPEKTLTIREVADVEYLEEELRQALNRAGLQAEGTGPGGDAAGPAL